MTCSRPVNQLTALIPWQRLILLLALCLALCAAATAQRVVIENPDALPVIDRANLLTADEESSITGRLQALARTDGTQVGVLTVPTTGDEDIFTFTHRTATAWGIGQREEDSGVLFVVASDDRNMRIHVGYGLEGRLTDALSKRIISREVTPDFRAGNYAKGISDGVDAIIAAVRGEYKAPPEEGGGGGGEGMFWLVITALVMFFLLNWWGGGRGGRGGRRRRHGLTVLPNVWTTGGGRSGGWGHSGGDFGGGGGFGGGFGGGSFGGGGASGSW